MEIQVAAAKVSKYAVRESGDTLEMIERPGGGLSFVLAAFSSALSCLLAPALFAGFVLGLIAWFVAAKEALDLEWAQTIITVLIGWLVLIVMAIIAGAVLGLLGVTARGLLGAVSGQ